MLSDKNRGVITSYFHAELDNPQRNVYFDSYYCSRNLSSELVRELLDDVVDSEITESKRVNDNSILFRIGGEPVLFIQPKDEQWIVVYSTALRDRDRKDISDLASIRGWMIEGWIQSEVINSIYHEYTPGDESININRKWDPYWIYQREGEVPEELADFYSENLDKFVEREIEFSLKTPRRLVDEALEMGATKELLQRSEISKSVFKIQVPSQDGIHSDGGIMSTSTGDTPLSSVTVRETGKVAHNSGDVDATFYLLDEIDRRSTLRGELEPVIGEKRYQKHDDGSFELTDFRPSKILRIVFRAEKYGAEASLKLSNLLTVGQDDVEIHGVIKYRDSAEFIAESYTTFDNGEYDIYFTGEFSGDGKRPVLYIKPRHASVSGLMYLFQKLRSKYDPRISKEVVDYFPSTGGDE